ncbi:MAG TPA: YciI family protein [Verrucomicrobiae bacterium]
MSAKNEYMLLFRGNHVHSGMSPEQMQEVAGQMMAWFKRLADQGKVLGGSPLDNKGKVVSGKGGRVVADGPFAESKEAVGGYFMLQVDTMDEAVAIAQECPMLPHGGKVEVRQVLEKCPFSGEAVPDIELAEATA